MIDEVPTAAALTDAACADLAAHGLDRVHVLGTRSAAGSPSNSAGGSAPFHHRHFAERDGCAVRTPEPRDADGRLPPLQPAAAALDRGPVHDTGRSFCPARGTAGIPVRAPGGGRCPKARFAEQAGFWSTLWYAIMLDVPTGLDSIDCPVIVAQGLLDVVGSGQTPRYCPTDP
jgi:pimeloyl-ACP methyl ester carboxylesterase